MERTRGRNLTLALSVLCNAGSTTKPTFFVLQSKPLIPLQKEEDPETHKTVLTNYMFPQQIRTDDCEYCAFSKTEFLLTDLQTALVSDTGLLNVDVVGLKEITGCVYYIFYNTFNTQL